MRRGWNWQETLRYRRQGDVWTPRRRRRTFSTAVSRTRSPRLYRRLVGGWRQRSRDRSGRAAGRTACRLLGHDAGAWRSRSPPARLALAAARAGACGSITPRSTLSVPLSSSCSFRDWSSRWVGARTWPKRQAARRRQAARHFGDAGADTLTLPRQGPAKTLRGRDWDPPARRRAAIVAPGVEAPSWRSGTTPRSDSGVSVSAGRATAGSTVRQRPECCSRPTAGSSFVGPPRRWARTLSWYPCVVPSVRRTSRPEPSSQRCSW